MAKQYQWQLFFSADGPLDAGFVGSPDLSVHTTDATSGVATATYYCVDSNNLNGAPAGWWRNNRSSEFVTVITSWTASIDNRNNLTINTTTKIQRIWRGDVVGSPTQYDNSGRWIRVYHQQGGTELWNYHDLNIAQAKEIGANINLGNYSFTLPPGGGSQSNHNTMYYFNKNDTYTTDGDRINMGLLFTNILPPDYRPGAIRDNGGVWQSHNRNNGEAHILTADSGSWREMRTESGLIAAGNPPSIRINNKWMNQRLIGKE